MVTFTTKQGAIRSILFDLMAASDGYLGTQLEAAEEVERRGRSAIRNGNLEVAKRIGRGFRGWLTPAEFTVPHLFIEQAVNDWRSPEHIAEHGWTVSYIGRRGESRYVIEEKEAEYVGPGVMRRKSDQVDDLKRTRAAIEFALDRTDGRSTDGKRYGRAIAGIDIAIDALNAVV